MKGGGDTWTRTDPMCRAVACAAASVARRGRGGRDPGQRDPQAGRQADATSPRPATGR